MERETVGVDFRKVGGGSFGVVTAFCAGPPRCPDWVKKHAVDVPVTADRAAIAAAIFPGQPPPGRGDAEGFPVTSPPRAVHAEILRDLGVNSDALAGYLGGGVAYVEVRTDGRTSTVLVTDDRYGTEVRLELSLTPDEPVVGVP